MKDFRHCKILFNVFGLLLTVPRLQIKNTNTYFIYVEMNNQKLLPVMKVEKKILQIASITTVELG